MPTIICVVKTHHSDVGEAFTVISSSLDVREATLTDSCSGRRSRPVVCEAESRGIVVKICRRRCKDQLYGAGHPIPLAQTK